MSKPPFNIDHLTEHELRDLHRRVTERLRIMHQVRAHGAMMNFSIGDRVEFDSHDGHRIVGTLIRYNSKSVTVIADGETELGGRWTVSLMLLRQVKPTNVKVVMNQAALPG